MDIFQELSLVLLKFKRSGTSYTFRCPYCGDSNLNNYKTRGYIFKSKQSNYAFKCHNCQVSKSLNNFLKENFPQLYSQYLYSNYKSKTTIKIIDKPENKIIKPDIFENFLTIKELHKNHPAKLYLNSRKIPDFFLEKFFYIEKFKEFTNKHKHTYNNLDSEESRIVIPLIINNNVVGFQGRLFSGTGIRYITIMLGEHPKVYNIDNIDWSKPVWICEGVYDSLFVPNCLAMLGSDIDFNFLESYKDVDFRFIYDNEPYNQQIISRMLKVVEKKHNICLWNSNIKEKDLNDCIINGIDLNQILNNYHSGIRGIWEVKKFAKKRY